MLTHDLGVVAEMCHRVVVMYAGKVVEEASVFDLFEAPNHHPYTKGLRLLQKRLNSIRGNVPSLDNMPQGCAFAPRCDDCFRKCEEAIPPVFLTNGKNGICKSRCWLSEEGSIGRE